jgi:hypothetical protein
MDLSTEPALHDLESVELESRVEAHLARLGIRGLPLVAVLLVCGIIAALVGPGDADGASSFADASGSVVRSDDGTGAAVGDGSPAAATPGAPAGGDAAGEPVGAGGGAGTGGGEGRGGPGQPAASSGCAGGDRQVPWTKYSPACVAPFEGDNGGATAPGVTGDTVTLVYRRQNTASQAAISALAGEAVPNDDEYIADLQTYAALFNQQYELYGRKVEVVPYQGQSDYLQEDLGNNQSLAQADAATARGLGAFIDITFPSAGSLFYSAALFDEGIIAYGFPLNPDEYYEQNAPYAINWWISGTGWAKWAANVVCQRMAGMPATFAGDPAMHGKERVFGLVGVEFPTWLQVADDIKARLSAQCGVDVAAFVTYAENLGTMQQDASSAVARMRDAGVTTVICFCDPLMPIFISQQASDQDYRPEWIFQNQYDAIDQQADQSQFAHAIAPGPPLRPKEQTEAYAAYKLVDPDGEPRSIYFQAAYATMLHVFGSLQSAGPDLNPASYLGGVFSMPPSLPGGDLGDWRFGSGAFTPVVSTGVAWWKTDKPSQNGRPGGWVDCEGGVSFPLDDPGSWGSGQLGCFR